MMTGRADIYAAFLLHISGDLDFASGINTSALDVLSVEVSDLCVKLQLGKWVLVAVYVAA